MLEYGSSKHHFKVDSVYHKAVAYERERHIETYMNRCFQVGRPIHRDKAGVKAVDKVAEFKRQFNRIGLMREFFNQDRENETKKFDMPIDDTGKPLQKRKHDLVQYCAQSDPGNTSSLSRSSSSDKSYASSMQSTHDKNLRNQDCALPFDFVI